MRDTQYSSIYLRVIPIPLWLSFRTLFEILAYVYQGRGNEEIKRKRNIFFSRPGSGEANTNGADELRKNRSGKKNNSATRFSTRT